jgi:hypothetical protein
MDPTRPDAMMWITSYASIRNAPGVPLFDFLQAGKRGDDPRMYFSWYSADFTTDAALIDADPERRANPSIASFPADYLPQQRKRLPAHKFRRLHLNLPGAPDGAAFDGDRVAAAIVPGRRRLPWEPIHHYRAFVDMSGGSSDDAVLAISHHDEFRNVTVLDEIVSQTGGIPFNPRDAVNKFVANLKLWNISRVTGDAYAGQTFRSDFQERGVEYRISSLTKAEIYDAFEPSLMLGKSNCSTTASCKSNCSRSLSAAGKSTTSQATTTTGPMPAQGPALLRRLSLERFFIGTEFRTAAAPITG